jgi:DNA-binding CsgD family transcriptional regulator
MSVPGRTDADGLRLAIPRAWRSFLRSGGPARARASIEGGGAAVPVDLTARLEFIDDRRLAIHLALADGAQPSHVDAADARVAQLTARERTVIALIAAGGETQQIADILHVAPSTVRTHVRNSMAKLGAHTRAQLVAIAITGDDPVEATQTLDGDAGKAA